jgi:DNA-binding MarR family transcriptional regulator
MAPLPFEDSSFDIVVPNVTWHERRRIFARISKKQVDSFPVSVYMHIKMTKELDLSAMENCVCFNLRWVTRAVTQFFDAELRRLGIRPTQTPILAALRAKPSWSMEELSDWLGMERTTLVRNSAHWSAMDWWKLLAGRGGHVSVSISTKGRKELEKATPAWRAAQQAVIKTLDRERWSAILSDLDRAALALTN